MKKLLTALLSLVLMASGAEAARTKTKGPKWHERQAQVLERLEKEQKVFEVTLTEKTNNFWIALARALREAGYYKVNGLLYASTQANPESRILSRNEPTGAKFRGVIRNGLLVEIQAEAKAETTTIVPVAVVVESSTPSAPIVTVEPPLPINKEMAPAPQTEVKPVEEPSIEIDGRQVGISTIQLFAEGLTEKEVTSGQAETESNERIVKAVMSDWQKAANFLEKNAETIDAKDLKKLYDFRKNYVTVQREAKAMAEEAKRAAVEKAEADRLAAEALAAQAGAKTPLPPPEEMGVVPWRPIVIVLGLFLTLFALYFARRQSGGKGTVKSSASSHVQ